MKLYVEGGGETAALKTACREGFTTFITKAGLTRRPRVVACGSRQDAYDSFCTAIANGQRAFLLVDSEAPVATQSQQGDPAAWNPWLHLKHRPGDNWDQPPGSADADCHLMVQCMESWILADREALKGFFGQGFKANQLPPSGSPSESIGKDTIYQALARSTQDCKTKAQYGKGEHSFKLLISIDPAKVGDASPWAKRFIDTLKAKMAESG